MPLAEELSEQLLAIEKHFWTGGPEAYRRHADDRCLIAFAEMAGVMSAAPHLNSGVPGTKASNAAQNWPR
jgi:hypothetical protein